MEKSKKKAARLYEKQIAGKHQRKWLDFKFPHVRTAVIIALLTIAILAVSIILNGREPFWSSIFANVFAGLITGLTLCIISGSKQRTIAELTNEQAFLLSLRQYLKEYFEYYSKMQRSSFEESGGSAALFDLIYDTCSRANWVNNHISQGKYDEAHSFDPCEYCRKHFDYDAVAMISVNDTLHGFAHSVDVDNPPKQEVIRQFEAVDKPLRKLNSLVYRKLEAIDLRLEAITHSLI